MNKKIIFLFTLLCSISSLQARHVDLSTVKDLESFTAFREKVYDTMERFSTKGVWNGIRTSYISCGKESLQFAIDTDEPFEAQKLLAYLEKNFGAALLAEEDYSRTTYTANTKAFDLSAEIRKTGKEPFGKNTEATLKIFFKKSYAQPLPNLAYTQPKQPNGIFYYIKTSCFNNSYDITANGITVVTHTGRNRYVDEERYILNKYLLQPGKVDIHIQITPGMDENGHARPAIIKNSFFKAFLCSGRLVNGELTEEHSQPVCSYYEYVTDTIKEDGETRYSSYPGTYRYGAAALEDTYSFMASIPYNLQGWKSGKDLRHEPRLKEQIIVAYEQLATAFKNKDAALLNDLLYQAHQESMTAGYGLLWNNTDKLWCSWEQLFGRAFSFKVAADFDIAYSKDGRFVSVMPHDQKDMLRVVGKGQAAGFTYSMYMDSSSNKLKFIRDEY